jgi:hypothetical protein
MAVAGPRNSVKIIITMMMTAAITVAVMLPYYGVNGYGGTHPNNNIRQYAETHACSSIATFTRV